MPEKQLISLEKDNYEKKILRFLDTWREIVLVVNTVLLWKKKTYPYILIAVTTFLFLELAHYDLSMLTTASFICLFMTFFDYIAPLLSNSLWSQESWTAQKQRELEEVSHTLAKVLVGFKHAWGTIIITKNSRPSLYYSVTIVTLLFLAWIGSVINNLFITYILVSVCLLIPGFLHHGLFDRYLHRSLQAGLRVLQYVYISVNKDKNQ